MIRPGPSLKSALLAGVPAENGHLVDELESLELTVWSAAHAAEAIELAAQAEPDLVVLGEELDADPSQVISAIRAAAPRAPIVYLLSAPLIRRAAFLISLGMDDVIIPPHRGESILFRASMAPLLARKKDPRSGVDTIRVDRFSRTVLTGEHPVALTTREFQLLERLVDARGRVVSREDLLREIWGESQDNEAVLDATVHRLRRKLEVDVSTPRILVTVRGLGYRIEAGRIWISGA
jgi:two-component system response regulator RegX3